MFFSRISLTILLCGLLGVADGQRSQYSYVGEIPAVCPITIDLAADRPREGFAIQPLAAVRIASKLSWVTCNSKLQQLVYADRDNYYIVKTVYGPPTDESEAVIVDGHSGKVIVRHAQ